MDFWEAFDEAIPYLSTGVEKEERTSKLLGGMVAVELNNQAARLQRLGYAEPSGRLLKQAQRYAPDLASTKVNLEIQSLIAKGESLEEVITDKEWGKKAPQNHPLLPRFPFQDFFGTAVHSPSGPQFFWRRR